MREFLVYLIGVFRMCEGGGEMWVQGQNPAGWSVYGTKFVNECLNCDVLEKIFFTKTAKNTIIKN